MGRRFDEVHGAMQKLRIPALAFAIWVCWEVHYVLRQVFSDITAITGTVITALSVVFALPALGAAMIRWRRGDKFSLGEDDDT